MLFNNIKIAWRNLLKYKLFSFINIVGLAIALPFALISLMQVVSAFENDNFHPYPSTTYRIITNVEDAHGATTKQAISPKELSYYLKSNYPFVDAATHVIRFHGGEMNNRLKSRDVNGIYIEPAFYNMFGFRLAAGNAAVAPKTIVLTSETAAFYFGSQDPVGKVLIHPEYGDLVITGVLHPYKRGTHLRSDMLVSMATYELFKNQSNTKQLTGNTYVRVKTREDAASLDKALLAASSRFTARGEKKLSLAFRKQLVTDISPDFENLLNNSYVDSVGDHAFNFAFAFGLLLLAAFNYINLTLARSVSRAKEIGVRKVAGAFRHQLIFQFITEAVVVAILSLLLGYLVLLLIKQYSYVPWFVWKVDNQLLLWTCFIVFTCLIGVLAGALPAYLMSSLKPVSVLKGKVLPLSFGSLKFRNVLVVLQFTGTTVFMAAALSMFYQFKFMANDNTNFNRQNIYNVSIHGNYRPFVNEIGKLPAVESIGMASSSFGGGTARINLKVDALADAVEGNYYAADAGFVNNMNLHIIAGDNLTASGIERAAPRVLVNEQLLYALNLGEAAAAVGKTFFIADSTPVVIQGVLRDFCYYQYQFKAKPLVMQYQPDQFGMVSIKVAEGTDGRKLKADITKLWNMNYGSEPLAFSNFKQALYDRYFPGSDLRFMAIFCVVVLAISLMGLVGIVTYSTEKRMREVGIKKVLGAGLTFILKDLSAQFTKILLISAAICIPLGYIASFLITGFFAYNNGVPMLSIIMMFLLVFALALALVVLQSLRAGTVNPVKMLRNE